MSQPRSTTRTDQARRPIGFGRGHGGPGGRFMRPQEKAIPEQAREILVGSGGAQVARGGGSPGEQALLGAAGATGADPSIRTKIDKETVALAKAQDSFVNRLIFWQEKPPPGKVVDPDAEARRIQENAALGAPVTRGKSPVIERKEKGWLEGLF